MFQHSKLFPHAKNTNKQFFTETISHYFTRTRYLREMDYVNPLRLIFLRREKHLFCLSDSELEDVFADATDLREEEEIFEQKKLFSSTENAREISPNCSS